MRISVPAAALALGGSLALGALVAPAALAVPAAENCRTFGTANLYGEFVEGNDTHTPDAEGAVAIGGNADFTGGFSVGNELTADQVAKLPGGNALVVGGNLTGNVQVMKGNGVYAGDPQRQGRGARGHRHQGRLADRLRGGVHQAALALRRAGQARCGDDVPGRRQADPDRYGRDAEQLRPPEAHAHRGQGVLPQGAGRLRDGDQLGGGRLRPGPGRHHRLLPLGRGHQELPQRRQAAERGRMGRSARSCSGTSRTPPR